MNFRPELAEAVVTGRKWVTRRLVSHNPRSPYFPGNALRLHPGKRIAICPGRGKHAIGYAVIDDVRRELFDPRRVDHATARSEGFPHPAAFRETWEKLNGNLDPVDVWRIEFAEATSQPQPNTPEAE